MIAASYVKWIEAGGGRSIPIPYDATSTTLLDDILSQVDGVLFPGGGTDELPFAAIHIWKTLHTKQYYNRNSSSNNKDDDGEVDGRKEGPADMIPLWGTCLGFEFIVQLAASSYKKYNHHHTVVVNEVDDSTILEGGYNATNISLPLLNVQRSGLYQPDNIYYSVIQNSITMNNHHLGITPQRFLQSDNLVRMFDITSTNVDQNGKQFVSTIEPKQIANVGDGNKIGHHQRRLSSSKSSTPTLPSSSSSPPPPIYGVQFHPEKNAFEYGLYPHTNIPYEAIDHSPDGVTLSIYMSQFFIGLARDNVLWQNSATAANTTADKRSSKYTKVDRYPVVYTYPRQWGVKFEEIYIIPPASHWERDLTPSSTSLTTSTATSSGL
jgi:gamma-glutamyl hydrolase